MNVRQMAAGGLVVTLLMAGAPALLSQASAAGCESVRAAGAWTTIDFPLATTMDNQVVVDRFDAKRIFVTDGSSVSRSEDGGCTWSSVFGVAQVDASALPGGATSTQTAQPYFISSVVLPRAAGAKDVYLLLSPGTAAQIAMQLAGPTAPPVLVARSTDGGASFSVQPAAGADIGAVPRCNTSTLAVAPSSPTTLYLACAGQVLAGNFADLKPVSSTTEVIYRSADGGASWERGEQKDLPNPPSHLEDLIVDPYDPKTLYGRLMVYAPAGAVLLVTHSRDGGATWKTLYSAPPVPGDNTMFGLDLSRPRASAPARLVAWGPAGVVESGDAGTSWSRVPVTAPKKALFSAAYDGRGQQLKVTASAGDACGDKTSLLTVFTVRGGIRAGSSSPLVLAPAPGSAQVVSLSGAAGSSVAGLARIDPEKGSPADAAGCTVQPPVPPAPAPPVAPPVTWKSIITLHTA